MAFPRQQSVPTWQAPARLLAAACCVLFPLHAALADVIVLANRTGLPLALRFKAGAGAWQGFNLPAGDAQPLFVDGAGQVEFNAAGQVRQYQLDANSAYYFGRADGGVVDLQKIGLGDAPSVRSPAGTGLRAQPPVVLVKIYVDEEEPALQFVWEARLRRRVEAAAVIIEKHSRVQLKVVGVGTWNSDNSTIEFTTSLAEFAREVNPAPAARLAVGFTSQFPTTRGRIHMAGTRGPLDTHILVREGSSQLNEAERIEFLVHELGHFLGASHSPEQNSVMRPVLGDNQAGRVGFQIRFDPVNTLIMSMIGEEMGRRNVQTFADVSNGTKQRLQSIYSALSRTLPDDPAGGHFMRIAETTANAPLAANARRVLLGLVLAATENRARLPGPSPIPGQPERRTGDALTEYLVRSAAAAANTLPAEAGSPAFLLALAIGLDDSNLVQSFDAARSAAPAVESPEQRRIRMTMLGEPTLLGRRDAAGRFFAAAYLASAVGADSARQILLAREAAKVKEGGFDFALAAIDRAGVRWGADISRGRFPMRMLANGFSPAVVLPKIDDLPGELPAEEFAARFGAPDDERFRGQLFTIDQRISQMPIYRTPAPFVGK